MKRNDNQNNFVKWVVIVTDFLLLNLLLFLCAWFYPKMADWDGAKVRMFIIIFNIALMISHYYYPPMIHLRVVSVGHILRRVIKLDAIMVLLAYLIMKGINLSEARIGVQLMTIGVIFFFILLISRFLERSIIKNFRRIGHNVRRVLFVGADSELINIYIRLNDDASKGYHVVGYYADKEIENVPENVTLTKLGTLQEFMNDVKGADVLPEIDELYVSISRQERDTIKKISNYCDQNVVRFYYVPVSLETLGINLKRELLDDIEIVTTYENPLQNPMNKLIKRIFDIVCSTLILLCVLPLFPIIWLIIKIQSPGPLFFKQMRTGLDGKNFYCYKFRSMHVNDDADKVQATENDPRKYPFGNFMRKANIDEFPQFWNVLIGDMSIVGPRPHMLAHTEQYSQLIEKYMVRHFVKPGVTGWAQVTGYRGETKELWQMEGRVKRDIWYMENWSIWLDIRIMWMTAKSIFIHDKNAY